MIINFPAKIYPNSIPNNFKKIKIIDIDKNIPSINKKNYKTNALYI